MRSEFVYKLDLCLCYSDCVSVRLHFFEQKSDEIGNFCVMTQGKEYKNLHRHVNSVKYKLGNFSLFLEKNLLSVSNLNLYLLIRNRRKNCYIRIY